MDDQGRYVGGTCAKWIPTLSKNPKSSINRSFALLLGTFVIWQFGEYFQCSAPDEVREKWGMKKTPIIWVTFKAIDNAISPKDIEAIKSAISDFVRKTEKSCILLDCFREIMLVNGFERGVNFLKDIKELCKGNGSILLLSINPGMYSYLIGK